MKQKINLKQRGPTKPKVIYLKWFKKPLEKQLKKKRENKNNPYQKRTTTLIYLLMGNNEKQNNSRGTKTGMRN